jgi:hypothetical protein
MQFLRSSSWSDANEQIINHSLHRISCIFHLSILSIVFFYWSQQLTAALGKLAFALGSHFFITVTIIRSIVDRTEMCSIEPKPSEMRELALEHYDMTGS